MFIQLNKEARICYQMIHIFLFDFPRLSNGNRCRSSRVAVECVWASNIEGRKEGRGNSYKGDGQNERNAIVGY